MSQVQGGGFAMVGEQMPVTVTATAADAVAQAELEIKAEYLEGGGHSELQILVSQDGSTRELQVAQLPLLRLRPILTQTK